MGQNVKRIHVFGASGSGTTTLAAALSMQINCPHYDADDYFWLPTAPPFQQARERSERVRMLLADLNAQEKWVLSGSICKWDEQVTPMFDLAVFLWIPTDIRIERLEKREIERYGDEVVRPGGVWAADTANFLDWAKSYDDGGPDMRSRLLHETWMTDLPCPVLRLEGDMTVDERVCRVMGAIGDQASDGSGCHPIL